MESDNKDQTITMPQLVSNVDIAKMAKVTPSAIPNWKVRYCHENADENPNSIPKFPTPAVVTGAGPLYRKDEIEAWLEARRERQGAT